MMKVSYIRKRGDVNTVRKTMDKRGRKILYSTKTIKNPNVLLKNPKKFQVSLAFDRKSIIIMEALLRKYPADNSL